MIALTVIVGLIALGLLVFGGYRMVVDYEGGLSAGTGFVLGIVWVVLFIGISNVQFSNDTLTGYIYSKDSKWGVTNYHIRFSETAGEDVQPSFCANSDTQNARDLDAVVGTGKKVTVNIPSKGWYFSNDVYHCASDAVLEK